MQGKEVRIHRPGRKEEVIPNFQMVDEPVTPVLRNLPCCLHDVAGGEHPQRQGGTNLRGMLLLLRACRRLGAMALRRGNVVLQKVLPRPAGGEFSDGGTGSRRRRRGGRRQDRIQDRWVQTQERVAVIGLRHVVQGRYVPRFEIFDEGKLLDPCCGWGWHTRSNRCRRPCGPSKLAHNPWYPAPTIRTTIDPLLPQ